MLEVYPNVIKYDWETFTGQRNTIPVPLAILQSDA